MIAGDKGHLKSNGHIIANGDSAPGVKKHLTIYKSIITNFNIPETSTTKAFFQGGTTTAFHSEKSRHKWTYITAGTPFRGQTTENQVTYAMRHRHKLDFHNIAKAAHSFIVRRFHYMATL